MLELIAGLLIFLGLHSVRVFAADWRSRQIANLGDKAWKLSYTALSLLGFGLIIYGYGQARMAQVILWQPLPGMSHLAALLTLLAFILLAIVDYISDDNPDAALALMDEIQGKVEQLPAHPKRCRPGRVNGTRELVVRPNYIVVYAETPALVTVLRVLHAAQMWP